MIPLLSAGRGSVLQTSAVSIGMLHNASFNFGDWLFGTILIFLNGSCLATSALSSLWISLNSFESSQTSSILQTAWHHLIIFNYVPKDNIHLGAIEIKNISSLYHFYTLSILNHLSFKKKLWALKYLFCRLCSFVLLWTRHVYAQYLQNFRIFSSNMSWETCCVCCCPFLIKLCYYFHN